MSITAGSMMGRLRAETAPLHRRVESDLDLLGPSTSWLDYRLYLFRMYGFHAPIEGALGAVRELAAVVPDAALRNNKLALLAHDLVALGVDRRELGQLPRMALPGVDDVAHALGWMYVLEAATVDGKQLATATMPRRDGTCSASTSNDTRPRIRRARTASSRRLATRTRASTAGCDRRSPRAPRSRTPDPRARRASRAGHRTRCPRARADAGRGGRLPDPAGRERGRMPDAAAGSRTRWSRARADAGRGGRLPDPLVESAADAGRGGQVPDTLSG